MCILMEHPQPKSERVSPKTKKKSMESIQGQVDGKCLHGLQKMGVAYQMLEDAST